MKGDIMGIVFGILEHAAYTTGQLFEVFTSTYGHSYKTLRGMQRGGRRVEAVTVDDKHRFYDTLSRLQKQGFIERAQKSRLGSWHLTPKGIMRSSVFKKQKQEFLPLPTLELESTKLVSPKKEWSILTFDIPEKERRKRGWLRQVLKALGFQMIHKSVWVGKAQFPKSLIEELERLQLLPYIEIFAISKTGTLKRLQ